MGRWHSAEDRGARPTLLRSPAPAGENPDASERLAAELAAAEARILALVAARGDAKRALIVARRIAPKRVRRHERELDRLEHLLLRARRDRARLLRGDPPATALPVACRVRRTAAQGDPTPTPFDRGSLLANRFARRAA